MQKILTVLETQIMFIVVKGNVVQLTVKIALLPLQVLIAQKEKHAQVWKLWSVL